EYAAARSQHTSRSIVGARPAALYHHSQNSLQSGAPRHADRRPIGDSPRQRRKGTASLHVSQQSILEQRSQCSNGQFAGRYIPICLEPVRRLAAPRLGGCADAYRSSAHTQYRRTLVELFEDVAMNLLAKELDSALTEKISVRDLKFYYGSTL